MGCLLGWLCCTAAGQTSAPYVPKHPSDSWYTLLTRGGMKRSQQGWYMNLPNGLQDLIVMNYIDGYSYGPHAIWGHVNQDRSRWELEETLRWAESRERWVAKAALRYVWPVEWQSYISVYGGQHMEDFDEDPVMPQQQSLMASGLFGWNHNKLLERTQAGIKFSTAVTVSTLLTADLRWERRRGKENLRNRNMFGTPAESNVPRIRNGSDEPELTLYGGPVDAELAKACLQFDFMSDPTLYVVDDMVSMLSSQSPHYCLKLDFGQGVGAQYRNMRFISLDMSVRQSLALARDYDQLRYYLSAGAMLTHGDVGLADWHHLDASRFWWQRSDGLTRFALLDNYELSSDRWWSEAHVEWSSERMLLTRLTEVAGLRERVQIHVAQVASHPVHCEYRYGWDLFGQLGLDVTFGFDDFRSAGAALGLTLNLQQVQKELDALKQRTPVR